MKITAFADNPFLARMAGAPGWGLGGVRAIESGDPAGTVSQTLNGNVGHTFF